MEIRFNKIEQPGKEDCWVTCKGRRPNMTVRFRPGKAEAEAQAEAEQAEPSAGPQAAQEAQA